MVVGLTGPGSFLMGLMSSYSGCHLWVPGESPSDQRQSLTIRVSGERVGMECPGWSNGTSEVCVV